ncbi:hypothetical protein TYRP_022434 [Tyrophagus putrescentiae]|nr:hypothetical protein TYRP_022434 [Tyrophagus putrescentiae]
MPQLHALAQPQLPLPRPNQNHPQSGLEGGSKVATSPTSALPWLMPSFMHWPAATTTLCLGRTKATLKSGLEGGSKAATAHSSAVADAPASCTGPAATPSASAEPKPPSKVASKEEAKQPPPILSAVADAPASCTGPAATPLCLDRTKTTLKSGLEGGSKVATRPLLPWLMPSFNALAQPQLPLPRPNQNHPQSGLEGGSKVATAHFCRG